MVEEGSSIISISGQCQWEKTEGRMKEQDGKKNKKKKKKSDEKNRMKGNEEQKKIICEW